MKLTLFVVTLILMSSLQTVPVHYQIPVHCPIPICVEW